MLYMLYRLVFARAFDGSAIECLQRCAGFAAFLSAHQARFGAFTPTLAWLPFRLAAYMMNAAWRAGVIRFIIVTATKP
jgi:hypothetical protein